MQRITPVVRVFVLVFLANIILATSARAQATTADAFTSAEQGSQPPKPTAWTKISDSDPIFEKHDPFSYIHFVNDQVDRFEEESGPILVATTNGTVGPLKRSRMSTPTLVVHTRGASKIQHNALKWRQQFVSPNLDEEKRLSLLRAANKANAEDAHYYLAQANLLSKNWNEAWRQGEIIFKKAPDDDKRTQQMMELYGRAPERYMEYCIWCTRYLRVAKDWESFESAYYERQRVETICSARYPEFDDERAVDAAINVMHPLFVFFDNKADGNQNSNQENIFAFCAEQFEQWVVASGFKLGFYQIDNAKDADIIFEIKSPQRPYASNITADHVPTGYPRIPRLGNTETRRDKSGRTRSLITMYIENLPDFEYDMLSCICLHEVGHALGILKHTLGRGDVMDRYCGSPPLVQLSKKDCERVKELYKKAPVSDDALRQFALKICPW